MGGNLKESSGNERHLVRHDVKENELKPYVQTPNYVVNAQEGSNQYKGMQCSLYKLVLETQGTRLIGSGLD